MARLAKLRFRRRGPVHTGATRTFVAWWGSFPDGAATLGDYMSVYNLALWLRAQGAELDVGVGDGVDARPFDRAGFAALDWRSADPSRYGRFAFVCGPVVDEWPPFRELVERFSGCRRVAAGVSVLGERRRSTARLFDEIVARDGPGGSTFDLSLAQGWPEPVTGPRSHAALCLRGYQGEYGSSACRHRDAEAALGELAESLGLPVERVDTVVRPANGIEQIEAAFARSGIVLTTRLHGALLALRQGVPAVAVDQIAGGRKVAAVLRRISWPLVFTVDELEPARLAEAVTMARAPAFEAELVRAVGAAVDLSNEALEQAGRAVLGA